MKYMKVKERYGIKMDLQIFAGEGGDDSGDGDNQDDNPDDEDSDDDPDDKGEGEKKFTQKDVDAAVEKRLARERRKWNKQQAKTKDGGDAGKDGKEDSEDSKARKAAEARATKAEEKLACFEAGVTKESVEDVAALARAYMAKDEELDLEDAIEKVLKKYPHFRDSGDDPDNEEDNGTKKSWGQRQRGKTKKEKTLEDEIAEALYG